MISTDTSPKLAMRTKTEKIANKLNIRFSLIQVQNLASPKNEKVLNELNG